MSGRRLLSCCIILLLLSCVPGFAGEPDSETVFQNYLTHPDPLLGDLSDAEVMRLGARMYQDGILPSGEIMEAFFGEMRIDSSAFSCSSCHLRSGLGSVEGGVVTPASTGRKLYKPYSRPPSIQDRVDINGRYSYAKTTQKRPAYTREALKEALYYGDDPAGTTFNGIMPRYPLSKRDMAILVRYLELLSAEASPGASPVFIKYATIITDDVSATDRKALLTRLNQFINSQNHQVDLYRNFLKFGYKPTGDMKYSFRGASLAVWELKGAPETWQQQLSAYYQANPVFVVLGGISNQSWQPIHDFCEAQHLPCLYPITALPGLGANSWYTFYFNKGFYLEGDAAAHFIHRRSEQVSNSKMLQLVQDSVEGNALALGFARARQNLRQPAVERINLSSAQLQDYSGLSALIKQKKPQIILLWANSTVLPGLQEIVSQAAAGAKVFASSTLLGAQTIDISDQLRDQVFLTFPYRMKPYYGDEEGTGKLAPVPINVSYTRFSDRRIESRTAIMLSQSVTEGLRLLYDNLTRDYLVDVLSMQMDRIVYDFERLSFGPSQRFASKGCYIIQLGQGPQPELIQRSEWVIR